MVQCLTEAHRKALATLPLAAMNVQRLYDELEPILPELVSKESASEKAQRYRKEAGHWNGLAAIYRSTNVVSCCGHGWAPAALSSTACPRAMLLIFSSWR